MTLPSASPPPGWGATITAAPAPAPAAAIGGHQHDGCCDHGMHLGQSGDLLTRGEKRSLATRLTLALLCGGLLLISLAIHLGWPQQRELASLVAGVAALLVAGPVLREAWHALASPSLHGVTDLLVAVAMIAAWVVGDLETAALVPLARRGPGNWSVAQTMCWGGDITG